MIHYRIKGISLDKISGRDLGSKYIYIYIYITTAGEKRDTGKPDGTLGTTLAGGYWPAVMTTSRNSGGTAVPSGRGQMTVCGGFGVTAGLMGRASSTGPSQLSLGLIKVTRSVKPSLGLR